MKFQKFIFRTFFIFFSVTVFISACSKNDALPGNTQPQSSRTTNMFGFPLTNTGCRLSKIYDSATNMLETVYVYNADGSLKSEVSGTDSVNYLYDSIYRLVKITDKGSDEEWKITYSGTSTQSNRLDYKDLLSSSTFSVNISYPAANTVLFSSTGTVKKIDYTINFDGNYNPTKAIYKETSISSGSTLYSTETTTQFSATVLSPIYPLPTGEYGLFSFLGTLYEGANIICGKNIGTIDTYKNYTEPVYNFTANFLTSNINSKGYPIYLRNQHTSDTYKFEYIIQ